jgi:hypothetical protein
LLPQNGLYYIIQEEGDNRSFPTIDLPAQHALMADTSTSQFQEVRIGDTTRWIVV